MRSEPDPPYVPTPEEIERACEAIRATWSRETEAERRCGGVRDPAVIPVYSIHNGRRDQVLVETL